MENLLIQVDALTKIYRVPERGEGLRAAIQHLTHPVFTEVPAVSDVSFRIEPGEVIGLIGPNGAGKTTILKILGGLLYPTGGTATVAGYTPWQRKPDFLRKISMVLGNKSQLIWDIPALDTLRVLGEIYNIPSAQYEQQIKILVELLNMGDLLRRPVRNLSLGERMKCELAAGLLHAPKILFLDEPTLGLDFSTQNRLRTFITEYNHRTGATIILTSHYLGDITALCSRVLLLHEGRILYDGQLNGLAARLAPYKLLRITLATMDVQDVLDKLPAGAELLEQTENVLSIRVARDKTAQLTSAVLKALPVADLSVEDPPLEAVIDKVYQGGTQWKE